MRHTTTSADAVRRSPMHLLTFAITRAFVARQIAARAMPVPPVRRHLRSMRTSLLASVLGWLWLVSSPVHAQTISASQMHTCATSKQGALYCWGSVSFDGAVGWRGVHPDSGWIDPRALTGGRAVSRVMSGWMFDCVLTRSGRTLCDGQNHFAVLGRPNAIDRRKDVRTSQRFTSIAVGMFHACGLTRSGRAYCWGSNDAGQVGVGSRVDSVPVPTAVVGGHRFRSLSAGSRHTCGITRDGRTLCWGANSNGQLGRDPALHGCAPNSNCMGVPMPVDVAHQYVTLGAGEAHTCGITSDGTAYCWGEGYSNYSQTGRTPVPVQPTRIVSSLRFREVVSGLRFSCGLADDGRVACWGVDQRPPLSRWPYASAGGPPNLLITDAAIVSTFRFRAIAAGHSHACGIGRSGFTYCWGTRDVRRASPESRDSSARDRSVDIAPRLVPIPNLLTDVRRVGRALERQVVQHTPSRCLQQPSEVGLLMWAIRRLVSREEDSTAAAERERRRLQLPTMAAASVVTITTPAICARAVQAYGTHRYGAEVGWRTNALVFRVGGRYVVHAGELHDRGYLFLVFDRRWRLLSRGWFDASGNVTPSEAPWPGPPAAAPTPNHSRRPRSL